MAVNVQLYTVYVLLAIGLWLPICNSSESPKSIGKYCKPNCQLVIVNKSRMYNEFMKKVNNPTIILIYFNIRKEGIPFYHSGEDDHMYAWSRKIVGPHLFIMPLHYMSYLFLPIFLQTNLQLDVYESEVGCLSLVNEICRKRIIVQALIHFSKINKCDENICDTLCSRRIIKGKTMKYDGDHYSCCIPSTIDNQAINSNECLDSIFGWLFFKIEDQIIIFSIVTAVIFLFKFAELYLRWHAR